LEAIRKDEDSVALQAIEYWSTICDVEIDILMEIDEVYILHSGRSEALIFFSVCIVKDAAHSAMPELYQGRHEILGSCVRRGSY
jgi:hypothetical protein